MEFSLDHDYVITADQKRGDETRNIPPLPTPAHVTALVIRNMVNLKYDRGMPSAESAIFGKIDRKLQIACERTKALTIELSEDQFDWLYTLLESGSVNPLLAAWKETLWEYVKDLRLRMQEGRNSST